MGENKTGGFLLNEEIRKIRESSLEVLSEVGVKITHSQVRQRLLEAGVKEGSNAVLYFPRSLIEKKAPAH